MFRKLCMGLSILIVVQSTYGYDFSNNFILRSVVPVTKDKPSMAPSSSQPAPQVAVTYRAEVFSHGSTSAPAPQSPVNTPAVSDLPFIDEEPKSSEVVSHTPAETPLAHPEPLGPETSLRPQAAPPRPPARSAAPVATPAPANTILYDMRNCSYSRGGDSDSRCYGSLTTAQRAKRIMNAAHYVNRIHGTHFDGRYMLCTGWRESNFNPGARGAAGEKGMFQVMRDTAGAALRHGPELQEFKNMSRDKYLDRMKNSTLAQVELSFLVLQMKISDFSELQTRRPRIMGGGGTVEDYRRLAGRYNGGGYHSTYARKISDCYKCMRGQISATATAVGNNIQPCLRKAK